MELETEYRGENAKNIVQIGNYMDKQIMRKSNEALINNSET